MTIALRQLRQVVTGSDGRVEPDPTLGGYLLLMPSGMTLFGVLAELSQLGLDPEHIQLWGGRTAWIMPKGVRK